MQAPHPGLVDELGRAGEHAALAGGEVLGGVERERDEVGEVESRLGRSDHPSVDESGQRVRGVLDHRQAVAACDVVDGLHVSRVAVQVDGHDRLHARRALDGGLYLLGVDVEGVGLDVDEHRFGELMLDDVDRRGERHRGADHGVAFADAQDGERHMKRRGGGVERERGGGADVAGELGLETGRPRPGGDPAFA